nr:MAG TPA: Commissureless [Caudoviricetes sp.]
MITLGIIFVICACCTKRTFWKCVFWTLAILSVF